MSCSSRKREAGSRPILLRLPASGFPLPALKASILILTAVVWGVAVAATAAENPYERAETLAAQRRFSLAEAEYRYALRQRPRDWRLRLGLARVILWDGRYREAERHFAALLAERPRDPAVLLGHAQAAYWSGDYRGATARYRRLLAVDPQHAEARKVLGDLAALSAPRYEIAGTHRDDSQPYRLSGMRAVFSYFSDPLTRWDVRGSAGSARGGGSALGSLGAGVSIGVPALRAGIEGWAGQFRFPDGATDVVGELSVRRTLPLRSAVVASIEKRPLLMTAGSVDAHVTARQTTLTWRRDPTERWLAAVNAHIVEYSDGNRGWGADAWAVAPIVSTPRFNLRGGFSAAWRDTDENRFRFTAFESEPLPSGGFAYRFTGVYDPYWTPHELREGRLVLVAETARLKVQADAGYARDRALAFSPPSGPAPVPPFTFPIMIDRSFRPWRLAAELTVPVGAGIEIRARYRHDVTVFYRANEIEASLGGRL
ncbi:MAG TPA: tetratricopeptide repeat protein [Thermoanaerobaculia bacterium]|nr:tetratricopeptide repeat protein [Thermoanaerobaculia bacterium]